MGFLKRLIGGGDRGPDWTGGMSGDEFRHYLDLVGEEQRRRGRTFRIEDDGLFVERPEGGDPIIFGLSNLAMLCRGANPADWPRLIATHFANIEAAMTDETSYDDFETARPFLKVRVYGRGDLSPELLDAITLQPLTPDLIATLVLDLPTTVRTLPKQLAAGWPEPVDRLFAIGTEHLAEEVGTYERATLQLDGAAVVQRLTGDSFFVASQVIRLASLVPDAPNGVAVSIPNRHVLLWHPLQDGDHARTALMAMTMIGWEAFDEGPGSLSPHLHWWHGGALTPLPSARVGKQKVEPQWPDAFIELLRSLPSAGST